jgi:hypothetical protein
VLSKVTNKYEVEAYDKIFTKDEADVRFAANQHFHSFLPKYYGSFTNAESGETYIKLENLLQGRANANILDLKMGTTSITVNTPLDQYERANEKDAKTTSVSLGFRVTGYIIKDKEGKVIEKEVKPHGKALAEHIPGIISKVLSGNDLGSINQEALDFVTKRAGEMLEYFENHHSRMITGSSVLMIIDNVSKSYEMKIIDLSSSKDFEDLSKRDEGYVLGLRNIISFLNGLKE